MYLNSRPSKRFSVQTEEIFRPKCTEWLQRPPEFQIHFIEGPDELEAGTGAISKVVALSNVV